MKFLRLLFSAFRFRLVAINDAAPERETGFLVAANATALSEYDGNTPPAREWLMISPYGEFPNRAGKQIVGKPQADKMVAAFNSVLGRAGRLFRGLPVYVGHPDVMPQRWPDDTRIGKIVGLDARADGLYGEVVWNDKGLRNREQGYHVYPSPAWLFPRNSAGTVVPDELLSVGMTNTPQIAESVPWTANSKTQTESEEPMKREDLIKALKLPADATDEQINAAFNSALTLAAEVETHRQVAANAQTALAAEQGKVTTLTGQLATANSAVEAERQTARAARAAHAKHLLDVAVNEGRITAADRATHETAFNADFVAAETALAAIKKAAVNTKEIQLGDARQSIATAAERTAVINDAVTAKMATDKCDYSIAYNAVKRDPRFAAVFEAMQKPAAN